MRTKPLKDPKWPEEGFYFHFKHDPTGSVNNYAYQVVGVGKDVDSDKLQIEYLPLYERPGVNPRLRCHRNLRDFVGNLTRDGVRHKRFTQITDKRIIARLEYLRDEMFKRATHR